MQVIGLLMLRDENDILADTLDTNAEFVDRFYVLDGSEDYDTAAAICYATGKCAGFTRDDELPDHYPDVTTDGCRQFIYEQAIREHGPDNWFLLLHGDEEWTFDPRRAIETVPEADGFEFRLPFAFPRRWDEKVSAFEQLTEFVLPGWPEFRMFRGSEDVRFDPEQHFLASPRGLRSIARLEWYILHFPYRSPEVQRHRAVKSKSWSPENFEAVREHDAVFWDDERIGRFISESEHYDRVAHIGL